MNPHTAAEETSGDSWRSKLIVVALSAVAGAAGGTIGMLLCHAMNGDMVGTPLSKFSWTAVPAGLFGGSAALLFALVAQANLLGTGLRKSALRLVMASILCGAVVGPAIFVVVLHHGVSITFPGP